MAGQRRALLIVNPKSRNGEAVLDGPSDRLRAGGIEIASVYRGPADGIGPEIARMRPRIDLVVAGGGDGTLNAVVAPLLEQALPLGILPLGTGNDLARTLGLPADLVEAAGVIVAGHQMRIDVGDVNGIPFLNVASIGMSAQLAEELTTDVKRRFGALGYALAGIRTLWRAHAFSAWITGPNGTVRVKTLQVAVGNGRHYGAGMTVAATARIDDQLLDLYSIETTRIWRLALMARALRTGRHIEWPDVRAERAARFEVRTKRPMAVNVDGELRSTTPARFSLRPRALSVFVPQPID
jgi:YegS/Rv2252/BmrU family lipid kinase